MVKTIENDRYFYKCSCDQLIKRQLVSQIISIIRESKKKWMKKNEIITEGRKNYSNWPNDRITVFRALKTMSKCDFLKEEKRGRGQATLWGLNQDQIKIKELMLYEIKQLEDVVSHLPHWAFTVEHFREEIEKIWHRIRISLIDIEKLDIALYWIIIDLKIRELLKSSAYKLLDKQLSIIYIFLILSHSKKLLNKCFDISQTPIAVKVDFPLINLMKKHFYPKDTIVSIFEKFDEYEFNSTLFQKLESINMMYLGTLQLGYKYKFKLFDKNKFSFLNSNGLEKHNEIIDLEKIMLFLERMKSKNFFMKLVKKRVYKPEDIDFFINNYKDLLTSSNH
jgi:hypothetical protein